MYPEGPQKEVEKTSLCNYEKADRDQWLEYAQDSSPKEKLAGLSSEQLAWHLASPTTTTHPQSSGESLWPTSCIWRWHSFQVWYVRFEMPFCSVISCGFVDPSKQVGKKPNEDEDEDAPSSSSSSSSSEVCILFLFLFLFLFLILRLLFLRLLFLRTLASALLNTSKEDRDAKRYLR